MTADERERLSIDVHAGISEHLIVGAAELFLLGSNPMITVLSGLEVEVEISAFGIGGEESGVLLGGHIEVLTDLSTLSEFQFQHPLFRRDRKSVV